MFNFSRETMKTSNKEPKAQNEFEYREMLKNKDVQSEFFKAIYPTLEKYNFALSFGESVGMHVYNAIVDLFENGCLMPFLNDYNRLKKRVSELEKEKEIVKEWLGRGESKAQNAATPRPQSFEDVFPPSPNGYWLL